MPLPTPNSGESQDDFISRCMSNDTAKEDFPDSDQRLAVCFSQWKERQAAAGPCRRFTSSPVQLRQLIPDEPATITGYAAVFHDDADPGTEYKLEFFGMRIRERIGRSAFDRALAETDDARALFNHDGNHLLGRVSAGTLRLSTDDTGLRYEIDPPDTQLGKDVVTSIRRGDLTGSSFAFFPEVERFENNPGGDGWDIRYIDQVALWDVGPVTYPAYESTSTGVRRAGQDELKQLYERWFLWREGNRKAARQQLERMKRTIWVHERQR